jgi:hypothetical protein
MRPTIHARNLKTLFLGIGLSALAFESSMLPVGAQIVTLADNNSIAQIDTGSSAGMFNWTVNGVNQLAQQWFWYRVGSAGPETPINTISAPSITTPNARTLYTRYNNGSLGVEVDYVLTGFSISSGQSHITETISLTNSSASSLALHFYQYSDFDLNGQTGGDTITLGKNLSGLFNEALQTKGNVSMHETTVTPGANHGEAALFNSTLVKLNNGSPDDLSDVAGPLTGDATWALQWDFVLAPGSSFAISKEKILTVPEPTVLTLISVGLVGLVLRRRKD